MQGSAIEGHKDTGHAESVRGYVGAVILIFAFGALSRITGFGREILMAFYLGANADTDSLIYSFIFYDMATTLGSAVLFASVPFFSAKLATGNVRYKDYWSYIAGFVLVLLTAIFVLQLLAVPAMAGLASGLNHSPAVFFRYLSVMVWCFLLLGWGSVQAALLQAHKRFLAPALTGAIMNIFTIVCLVGLHRRLGAMSVAVGVVGGLTVQLFIQELAVWKICSESREGTSADSQSTTRIEATVLLLKRIAGVAAALLVIKGMLFVDRWIALHSGVGAMSYLGYASRLTQVPLALVGFATSTALLPYQSSLRMKGASASYDSLTDRSVRVSFLVGAITTAMLIVLANPLVAIGYRHGHFTPTDATMTAAAIVSCAGMVVPLIVNMILQNVLLGFCKWTEYLPFSVGMLAIYVPLALLLSRTLGFLAVGYATSIVLWLYMGAVTTYLIHRGYLRFLPGMKGFVAKSLCAAGAAGLGTYFWNRLLLVSEASQTMRILLFRSITGFAIGISVFYVVSLALGLTEVRAIGRRLIGMLVRQGARFRRDTVESTL